MEEVVLLRSSDWPVGAATSESCPVSEARSETGPSATVVRSAHIPWTTASSAVPSRPCGRATSADPDEAPDRKWRSTASCMAAASWPSVSMMSSHRRSFGTKPRADTRWAARDPSEADRQARAHRGDRSDTDGHLRLLDADQSGARTVPLRRHGSEDGLRLGSTLDWCKSGTLSSSAAQ